MGRAGTSCAPQRRSSTPAHDTERCAIWPEAGTRPRWRKKRRPSATWRWALQQLIHRGSGSTDSTNSSDPPLLGRRTLPLNCTCDFPVWRGGLRVHTSRFLAIRRAAASAWRVASWACCARRAVGGTTTLRCRRLARSMPARIMPAGAGPSRASRLHAGCRRASGRNGRARAYVAASGGDARARSRTGLRFMFATRQVALRSVLIVLSPCSMRPTR